MTSRKSDRVYTYNRAVFLTLYSKIILDNSDGLKTDLREVWISLGAFRKNCKLFEFDFLKFGSCWSLNIILAGFSFGIGVVREKLPLFGFVN